ncbi:MAG: metallophosphoesterase [Myxococcota bacterium]|nr:metallophosphoesterase [Myxococcota bacterium]
MLRFARIPLVLAPALGVLTLMVLGCASFAPNVDGMYASAPSAAVAVGAPSLVLIGDIGLPRGEATERLAARVAQELESSPQAPVLVLGDVFYIVGLVGECPGYPGVSMFGCQEEQGAPADQLESVLGPYRHALATNPVIAIGGNHDFYGGEPAVRNQCELIPLAGEGWRYYARGCELSDENPVATLDYGDIVVFAVDSEPMIRDADFRERTVETLRGEIARIRAAKPDAWLLVATHHPLETHGSHNGATKVTGVLKDTYWLRTTALLPLFWPLQNWLGAQDPYELNYRAYRRALYRLFLDEPIDVFVSGHDHSLQHIAIEHPGVHTQIVSGAGANRSEVQRFGLDFLWLNRFFRLLGARDSLPAPRHELEFGLGGEIDQPDLSGYGFAVLSTESSEGRDARELVVEYIDPWREGTLHTSRIERE